MLSKMQFFKEFKGNYLWKYGIHNGLHSHLEIKNRPIINPKWTSFLTQNHPLRFPKTPPAPLSTDFQHTKEGCN